MAKERAKNIYVETDKGNMEKMKADYGVVFASNDKHMLTEVVGKATFEQMNDLIYSGLYHLYESAVHNFGEENRKQIYERGVQMFSLLMDQFYPEGKDTKYGILSDEDIKEAEDRKLDSLSKQKQS